MSQGRLNHGTSHAKRKAKIVNIRKIVKNFVTVNEYRKKYLIASKLYKFF